MITDSPTARHPLIPPPSGSPASDPSIPPPSYPPAHLPANGLTAARTAPLSPTLGPSRCSSSVSPPPPSGQASR